MVDWMDGEVVAVLVANQAAATAALRVVLLDILWVAGKAT